MIMDLTPTQRVEAQNWKPKLADDPNKPHRLQWRKDQLKEQIKVKKLAGMSEEEKAIYQIDEQIAKDQAAADARIEREQHLMQVPVSRAIEKLKAIREEIAADPSRKESELLRVDQAIAQWSEPQHNPAVSEFMLQAVLTDQSNHFDALESQVNERLATVEAERNALLAKRGKLPTPAPLAATAAARQRIAIQGETLEEKGEFLDAAVLESPEYRWSDVEAVTNARNALKRGDSAPLEALIAEYGEPANE